MLMLDAARYVQGVAVQSLIWTDAGLFGAGVRGLEAAAG
jgi:hypothetical protein